MDRKNSTLGNKVDLSIFNSKLTKSKRGVAPLLLVLIPVIPWILGLTLFGVPVFATWLKAITTPAKPVSPIWIAVGAFVVLLMLRRR